jgi:hypothetical protein
MVLNTAPWPLSRTAGGGRTSLGPLGSGLAQPTRAGTAADSTGSSVPRTDANSFPRWSGAGICTQHPHSPPHGSCRGRPCSSSWSQQQSSSIAATATTALHASFPARHTCVPNSHAPPITWTATSTKATILARREGIPVIIQTTPPGARPALAFAANRPGITRYPPPNRPAAPGEARSTATRRGEAPPPASKACSRRSRRLRPPRRRSSGPAVSRRAVLPPRSP